MNLGAVAITDHDTVDGAREALAAGIPPPLKFTTGVEISAQPPAPFVCSGSFHILGYGFRIDAARLNRTLETLQNARKNRNPRIIRRLNRLGMDLTFEELKDFVTNGQIGRPHIAQLMVKKGYARDINDAFDNYIGRGQPAYVDKYRLDAAEAIETIAEADGVAVLAHPQLAQVTAGGKLEDLIGALTDLGLKGLEVYYPEHTPENTALFAAWAKKHDLLVTGGTDFHGKLKPEIQMGSGKGDLFVPYSLYEKLISRS